MLRVQEMNLNVPVLIYIFNDGDDEMHKYSFIVFPHGEIQKKNTHELGLDKVVLDTKVTIQK